MSSDESPLWIAAKELGFSKVFQYTSKPHSAIRNPMRSEAHLNSASQGELVLSLSKEHPEDARKDDYGLQIVDCGFEIAQDRARQSRRWKLKDHSCLIQCRVCNQRSFNLKSKI